MLSLVRLLLEVLPLGDPTSVFMLARPAMQGRVHNTCLHDLVADNTGDSNMSTLLAIKQTANSKHSPLLSKLPGELRNKIYRYVLLQEAIEIQLAPIYEKTNLLRTCSQIRKEASAIFFSENIFVITNVSEHPTKHSEVVQFFDCIGPTYAASIPSLIFRQAAPSEVVVIFRLMAECRAKRESYRGGSRTVARKLGLDQTKHAQELVLGILKTTEKAMRRLAKLVVGLGVAPSTITAGPLDQIMERSSDRNNKTFNEMAATLCEIFLEFVKKREVRLARGRQCR